MRLLLTGVSGFVGLHTARAAIRDGHEVITVGRTPLSNELKKLGVKEFIWLGWPTKFAAAGLTELIQTFGQIDSVIHIAGDASYGNGKHYDEANVTPTYLLIESIKIVDPTIRFVFAISVGDQDFFRFRSTDLHNEESKPAPKSDYGRSKFKAEQIIVRSGLDYGIARLGMVIGRGMRSVSHVAVLMDNKLPRLVRRILTLFGGKLPIVHVNDAANALLMLAQNFVNQGTYLVVADNVPVKSFLSYPTLTSESKIFPYMAGFTFFLPAKYATALFPVMTFDSSKLRAIGWCPTISTCEAIDDVYTYLKDSSRSVHVVTGVASGLGRAVMDELIEAGSQVIGIDNNPTVISELKIQYEKVKFL